MHTFIKNNNNIQKSEPVSLDCVNAERLCPIYFFVFCFLGLKKSTLKTKNVFISIQKLFFVLKRSNVRILRP